MNHTVSRTWKNVNGNCRDRPYISSRSDLQDRNQLASLRQAWDEAPGSSPGPLERRRRAGPAARSFTIPSGITAAVSLQRLPVGESLPLASDDRDYPVCTPETGSVCKRSRTDGVESAACDMPRRWVGEWIRLAPGESPALPGIAGLRLGGWAGRCAGSCTRGEIRGSRCSPQWRRLRRRGWRCVTRATRHACSIGASPLPSLARGGLSRGDGQRPTAPG